MAFPLDGAFSTLRREVEAVVAALATFRQNLETAKGGGAAGSATGPSVAGAAAGVDKLTASTEKAARSSVRLRDALRDTSGAASGLQRSLASGGTLAKMFGFEEAGRKLDEFSRGLGAVKDMVTGIVAAGPALASMSATVGVVLAGVAAIQEGVRRGTGETLSLQNTIAGAALSVGQVISESVNGWKFAFNDLSLFVQQAFSSIGQAVLAPIRDALISIGLAMQEMGITLQKSTNPAIAATGNTLRDLARGAIAASDVIEGAHDRIADSAAEAVKRNEVDNRAIFDEIESTAEGVRAQINKLFDAPEGTGVLDALKKLVEGLNEVKAAGGASGDSERAERAVLESQMGSIRAGFTGAGGGPNGMFGTQARLALWEMMGFPSREGQTKEQRKALDQIEAEGKASHDAWAAAGATAGVEFTSGLLGELQKTGPQINEELFKALTTDPDSGKVITSFRKLMSNMLDVFKSNPLSIFGLFGSSSGVGGSVGGFATGGKVRGYATGGHIAASDTVPAMLTPGEFVQPVRAVSAYGAGLMEMIRQVRIPPAALHSLVAGYAGMAHSARPPTSHSIRGYADGGPVAGMAGGGSGGGMQVLPVMVTDRAGAEQLAHAGRGAILRLFSEDPDFRGLLNR
jgi:hypothetical protein